MSDLTITLTVDTVGLAAGGGNPDVSQYCQVDGDSNATDHTTPAKVGDEITWRGVSENGTDTVSINQIDFGVNVSAKNNSPFNDSRLDSGGASTITERTTNNPANKYEIEFSISNRPNKKYRLDPKMRMNT